ncbi:MAG: IS982 family transposase [bacterium]
MNFFHHSGDKTFKGYYCKHVCQHLKKAFPALVSYNRFVELKQQAVLPLMLFVKFHGTKKCSGISFIDSFPLKSCHARRESSHKTFKNVAMKGKTSVGWFYGFKVHLVVSHTGEIIDFDITPGNVADNNPGVVGKVTKKIFGKLFGDRGYISQKLFKNLHKRGVELITKLKKNMKNKIMQIYDKFLLRKRGMIESVIAILKGDFCIEHTRHRSPTNFLENVCSALAAYIFKPAKPSIGLPKHLLSMAA